jgi:hypothetical protein
MPKCQNCQKEKKGLGRKGNKFVCNECFEKSPSPN